MTPSALRSFLACFMGFSLAAGACAHRTPDAIRGDGAATKPAAPAPADSPYVPMALSPGARNEGGLWLGAAQMSDLVALGPRWKLQHDGYTPNAAIALRLRAAFPRDKGLHLDVVFGSWCGDSVREVPRFVKLVEALGAAAPPIRFVGVDYQKRDPSGLGILYGTKNVPTFVVLRRNVEIGRIIESPRVSLEADLLELVAGAEKPAK